MLKKFLRGVARSLIVIIIVSMVYSGVSFDISSTLKSLFGDVFAYSSGSAKDQTMARLIDTCQSVKEGASLFSINEICSNMTLLEKMKENCKNYRALKEQGIEVKNEEKIKESCSQIESEEIEKSCSSSKKTISPDLNKFEVLCSQYEAGEIDNKTFFAEFLSSPLGNQQIDLPQVRFFERVNRINNFLLKNYLIYIGSLAFFIILLYMLSEDLMVFLIIFGRACLSAGLIVMTPYIIIVSYHAVIGIDTTFILNSLYSYGTIIEPKSVISLILLLFLRMYNNTVLMWGGILLAMGITSVVIKYVFKEKEPPHY